MSFEDSYSRATDAIMTTLATATGYVENKNCFRYYLPNAVPVWGLFLGGGGSVDFQWHAESTNQVHMDCNVVGRFRHVTEAQEWCMKVLSAVPYGTAFAATSVNVHTLRIRRGGVPEIKFDVVQLANDTKESVVFQATVGLEAVWLTGIYAMP